jgi:flagellar biosynthesis protein FlhA
MVEHGWASWIACQLYTKLTIGDGLVSQIPAFVVSLGAGLIVTRTSSKKSRRRNAQPVFAKPKALMIAASSSA